MESISPEMITVLFFVLTTFGCGILSAAAVLWILRKAIAEVSAKLISETLKSHETPAPPMPTCVANSIEKRKPVFMDDAKAAQIEQDEIHSRPRKLS